MNVFSINSFREEKRRIKREKRGLFRILGTSLQRANKEHQCDRCISPIYPGEEYRRNVFLAKGVLVEKYHYPCCPGPTFDDWTNKEIERQREEERKGERQVA